MRAIDSEAGRKTAVQGLQKRPTAAIQAHPADTESACRTRPHGLP
jgi:hypothetical protein